MYSEREVWQVSGFTVDTAQPGHVQIAAQTPVDFRGSETKAEQGLHSGHGSGAPITFDQANFLNYQEAVAQLMSSEREVWQVSGFTVDTAQPGHVQIAAQTPVDFRGSETKAEQGLHELLDSGYELTLTAAAHGTLQRL